MTTLTKTKNFKKGEVRKILLELIDSNINGNIDNSRLLIEKLSNSGVYRNALNNFCNKAYGNYGAAELRFCYNYITKEEYINRINEGIKNQYLRYYPDTVYENTTLVISKTVGTMARSIAKNILVELAQKKYPGLTTTMVKKYINFRKATDYKVDICDSNDEIVNAFFESTQKLISWDTINHLKRIFGYEEELEVSQNYLDKKAFIKANTDNSEFLKFAAATGIENISCSQLEQNLKSLSTLNIDEEDLEILKKWFIGAKKTKKIARNVGRVTAGLVSYFGTSDRHKILNRFLLLVSADDTMPEIINKMAISGLAVIV